MTAFIDSRGEQALQRRTVPRRWMRRTLTITCAVVAVVGRGPSLVGQAAATDPKAVFVQALGRFAGDLNGDYGDEGGALQRDVALLDPALQQWDEGIAAHQASMLARLAGAEPSLAVRIQLSRAVVYLDRHRVNEALDVLHAAAALDATNADVQTLLGITYSQFASVPTAGDVAAATNAFQRASDLQPTDPIRAYMLAAHLSRAAAQAGTGGEPGPALSLALARVQQGWEQWAAASPRRAVASPFLIPGLIQEATGVEPFFPPALYMEGFGLIRDGEYERALVSFHAAVQKDPTTADFGAAAEPMRGAAAAFRNSDLAGALELLDRAATSEPALSEPRRVTGLVRLAQGRHESAVDALRTAVRLNPADERARLALASALTESMEYAAAEDVLRETVAALPTSGQSRYSLANLYDRQKRWAEAAVELERAAEFQPLSGMNRLYRNLGRLHAELRNRDRTIDAHENRVRVNPNDPGAHRALGNAYAQDGRQAEALAELAVVLLMTPGDAQAHAAMGDSYLKMGRFAEAATASQRALDLAPDLNAALYTHATALIRLGRREEGRQELQRFQQQQTEAAEARKRDLELSDLRRQASLESTEGDYAAAVDLLRRALIYEPGEARSHLSLGLALLAAGQFAEAAQRLETAAALNAPPEVHQYLADAYRALGRPEASAREQGLYERLRQQPAPSGAGR